MSITSNFKLTGGGGCTNGCLSPIKRRCERDCKNTERGTAAGLTHCYCIEDLLEQQEITLTTREGLKEAKKGSGKPVQHKQGSKNKRWKKLTWQWHVLKPQNNY